MTNHNCFKKNPFKFECDPVCDGCPFSLKKLVKNNDRRNAIKLGRAVLFIFTLFAIILFSTSIHFIWFPAWDQPRWPMAYEVFFKFSVKKYNRGVKVLTAKFGRIFGSKNLWHSFLVRNSQAVNCLLIQCLSSFWLDLNLKIMAAPFFWGKYVAEHKEWGKYLSKFHPIFLLLRKNSKVPKNRGPLLRCSFTKGVCYVSQRRCYPHYPTTFHFWQQSFRVFVEPSTTNFKPRRKKYQKISLKTFF